MVYAVFYKTSSFTKCRFVVKQYTLKRDWCLILLKLFWVFGKNSNFLIYSFIDTRFFTASGKIKKSFYQDHSDHIDILLL